MRLGIHSESSAEKSEFEFSFPHTYAIYCYDFVKTLIHRSITSVRRSSSFFFFFEFYYLWRYGDAHTQQLRTKCGKKRNENLNSSRFIYLVCFRCDTSQTYICSKHTVPQRNLNEFENVAAKKDFFHRYLMSTNVGE